MSSGLNLGDRIAARSRFNAAHVNDQSCVAGNADDGTRLIVEVPHSGDHRGSRARLGCCLHAQQHLGGTAERITAIIHRHPAGVGLLTAYYAVETRNRSDIGDDTDLFSCTLKLRPLLDV